MASERTTASSLKRAKRKQIRQNDVDLERFNSLPWNSSLSEDDPFSLLAGSNELEGGFLSLEEIDEVQYGLEIPRPEVESRKEKGKEKSRLSEESVKKCAGDEVGVEVEEEPESVKKKKKKKRKRKQKKTKKKSEEPEKDAGVGDNDCGDGVESIEVDENEDDGNVETEDDKSMDVSNSEDVVEEELADVEEYYAWNELRLHPMIMKSIYGLGFKEPTPIQKACIPAAAHQGKDVVGAAETGSGKTLAFGLPIFQRLLEEREKAARMVEERGVDRGEKVAPEGLLRALIITPTRELANQVTEHLKAVSKDTNFRVVAIVGGMSLDKQARLLKLRPEVVVGTPGRLWELMKGGEKHFAELHSLSFFVLDEADRMIENGHFHELRFIIDRLPLVNGSTDENLQNTQSCETHLNVQRKKRQTFVFSATIALSTDFRKKLKRGALKPKQTDGMESIETLSQRAGMRDNVAVFDLTNDSILANRLEESFIECREEDKDAYLYYILSVHGQGSTIVFCTSIAALRHLSSIMRTLGVNVLTLHAQMQQRARLKAIERFRGSKNENESRVLLATDVAARGIDIPGVRTVVHYQLPHSAEVYVHRSGRTARASADGCSIALIAPKETSKFASLCKSFSKESFQRFPFDISYMPEIMKRLSLARQIDRVLRKDSKEKAKKSWLERNAESIDLDIEGDESDDERANIHKQKKVSSANVKKLQQELKEMLSRPLQPKTFSRRYFAGAGVSHLLQNQFQELGSNQNLDDNTKSGESKRRKLLVIGQERMEPLQALRTAGQEVHMDIKEVAQKRKNMEILRRKRKEEKKRLRDQKRKQRKKMKTGV